MATVKKAQVIITANASVAQRVLEELDGAAKRAADRMKSLTDTAAPLKERMSQLAAEGKKDSEEFKQLDEQVKQLNKDYKAAEKEFQAFNTRVKENVKDIKRVEEVMKNLSGTATRDLRRALQAAKRELDKFSANDPRRQKLLTDMKLIQKQIDANTGAIKAQGNAFATTAKNLATYMIGFAGFNKIKSLVEGVFEANTKLSDSLANIRKVSGLSTEAINQLYRNIAKIDTRNTIETLNQLAYTGAKLGIGQNYGVEGLTGFVKAAEQVQMALGEDMGEKALPELSKMVEVMGLIPKYGVEQSMQKAASAIFQLGATSTATGSNIVEFSKRLMGLANVSRVSTQDLLALGSASDAMGLMPEVSATAFNKLFTAIQRQHNLIEKTLGMEKGRIKSLYDEGKTMDAIVEIFDRMNKTGNMNLLGSVFKDLGSDGARLINVMATMADRVDILKKHLITSRDAFKEGEAVIGEYMIQNQTAAALLERSSNLWAKAFTNPEGVDMVKQLAQAWYDVSKEMTQSDGLMFSLRASIDTISVAIKGLIKLFPYLIKFGISFAAIFAGKSIYFGVKSLIQAFRMLWTEIKLANTWGKALEATMSSNWILAAVAALMSLVTLLWDYVEAAKEAAEREAEHQRELQKSFAKSKDNIENVVKPLETYKKALDDATLSEKQRMAMVKQFKTDYQDYLDYLGIEIQSAVDLAKAYAQVVKVMKQKKAYEERENYRTEKNGENRMDRIAAQAQVEAAARSLGIEGVNKDFLYNTQHTRRGSQLIARGVNDIYRELMGRKIKGKFTTSARNPWEIFLINEETERIGDVDYGNKTLYDALNTYIKALREEEKVNKEVNQMFNSEYKNIDLEHFDINEFNDRVQRAQWKRKGSLDNDKPDSAAQKELTKAQQAEKKQLKLEMDQAEKDSTAVINAIEEFYRLQESAVEQLVADGKMTREEADKMIEYVRNRQDEMLMNARRAVAGKDSNFEQLRKTMGQDMLRPGDQNSKRALNTVQTIDVAEAARRLQKFDGSKGVYDLNAGSFTQAMLKNAAQNELNIQRRQAKVQEEIDKILMQYEYVEQAQREFGKKLVKLGLITDGYDKVVQQLADGTEIVANTNDVRALASKVVGMNASRLFGIDTGNATDLARLINYIMTDEQGVRESFASMFPSLNEWMANPDDYREQMQAFYKALIDMDSDYYKALKQNYEQQKREFTERWQAMGWSATQERQNTVFDTRDSLRKIGGQGLTFGQTYGFADTIADDPEIARIKNRMEWRARELEDLRARNASEELIMQKQNEMLKEAASLAEKVSSEVASRISKVQTLSEPLNAWGEEVGQKLGEVWQGISQDGKLSFGQMARNMGIEYAKLTLKMATENLMKQVQQGLFYKQMEMQAMAHETTLNAIQASGDAARIAAKQATGAALAGIQAAQNTTEISQEGAKAGVMTAFGISSGAAKTIAQLGWWGIPLIGVISSILMGLLNSAKATAGQSSSSSSSTNDAQKLKLVSNMLTYDEGNVGTYAGTDGHVYRAASNPAPGTGLITRPIATTVQGNPALVAERGPEIVVGRRATANIMRWNPALLNVLASYDPHSRRRTYDEGNVPSAAMPSQPTSPDGQTDPRMEATLAALSQTVALLSATVSELQKNGIPAVINKYGAGGLIDEVKSGLKFDKKYGR